MNAASGIVYFVGAGPGAPGLLTLRGAECLRRADIVLFDYLVNPELLAHTADSAEKLCLGRHGRSTKWPQEAINKKLVEEAKLGKIVVRLKGGDPMVFGRAAEEVGTVARENIPFEIVPGVTAALAGAAYSGIPITDRNHASAIAFVTGQENPTKESSAIDYGALARFPGTLVFYMGITTSQHWTSKLIENGLPADAHVTLLRRCSWPDQQAIHCRLDEVADRVTPYSKFPPPAIAIVGTTGERMIESWFEQLPLFGLTVLVSRPRHQAKEMSDHLRELGARVLLQPALRIEDPRDWQGVDDAILNLDRYDWIVFSSTNAVHQFMKRLDHLDRDIRALGSLKITAVGPHTAAALREYQLKPDLIPEDGYNAESVAALLEPFADGANFLLPRASRGREALENRLREAGGNVQSVVAYEHLDETTANPEVLEELAEGNIDWLVMTSPGIARSLDKLLGKHLSKVKTATISPLTSQAVRALGWQVAAEAETATSEGIVAAIVNEAQAQR